MYANKISDNTTHTRTRTYFEPHF